MGSSHIIGTNLDYGIIIGYFVLVLGFGAFFGRFTKSTKDFFFSGQRFPWWLIAFSMVATTVGFLTIVLAVWLWRAIYKFDVAFEVL